MKNKARVRQNHSISPASLQIKTPGKAAFYSGSPNEGLLEVSHSLSAKKRVEVAEQLARYAELLMISARKMDPSVAADFEPPVAMPKAFFLVNLPKWQKRELMKNAKASGFSLRCAMRWALHDLMDNMRDEARLARLTGITSPSDRVKRLFLPNRDQN